MHNDYKDIRSRITDPIKWWDEYAVPRYCDFTPSETADIYADQAILVHIQCQNCAHNFKVCFSSSVMSRMRITMDYTDEAKVLEAFNYKLWDDIKTQSVHYGDPPNIQCCAAGPTMNSEPIRVLEAWERQLGKEWKRKPECEIDLTIEET